MTADPLLLLSSADLREIASALEGGRLEVRPRISTLSVAQWAAPSQRAALASGLEALDMEAPVLHAKVIVVDDEEAFISSANFTESAQERNIEAGVHFRQASLAMALRRQFDTLVAKKRLHRLPLS